MVDESWEYKKAFEAYIRYGTPLELSLKKAKNKIIKSAQPAIISGALGAMAR